MNNNIPKEIYSDLKKSCINELTESMIYDKISQLSKDETNKELFKKLSISESLTKKNNVPSSSKKRKSFCFGFFLYLEIKD